ncbi:hypothetical protein MCOR29_010375 [Pyricularia oryzae]|nr:hypothetical protein MCOR01_010335 [Pyricularia oryzae]KAI6305754.1 hypothetical protein MCOR29_010375 [Pyricularia oryzae]KAI6312074.1 hypothetical protein MCOR30_010682 [Pyricularia oryzae]KAI6340178.1 hypothetical protein MCOR28_006792 [Pyricularia oryzae]KAI6413491.1 hypothetical protein MCOR20_002793 [Pyricularia oryzae]
MSDPKGKMVGFDSPERASAYFLEVLLRLQPYAQAVMIDRSYAPDCSYTHPLFYVPPVDLRGLTLPLADNLDSREAIKLVFRAKRTLFPQTVWKTEGSGFDSKSNKVFVLMQHKLDIAFMPKILNALHFKVATTLQLKPIYINLNDQTQTMPSESSGHVSNSRSAALTYQLGVSNSQDGISDGDRMQNECKTYSYSDMHNQYSGPAFFEELQGTANGSAAYTKEKQTVLGRVSIEDRGVDALLFGLDGSAPTTDSRSGSGESCCYSADAVCGGSCTGSGLALTTRWVICSQEDMMQPRDIVLCMLFFPAIAAFNWLQAAVYFVQRVKSALLFHDQAHVKAPRPGRSASARAESYNPVSESYAGPSSAAADTKTMDTALLPEEYEPAMARAVEKARANIVESVTNADAHLDNLPREDADIYGSESCFEGATYDEFMDANYGMRYTQGNLLKQLNSSLQRASAKSKSVRFTEESFGNEAGETEDTKCDAECSD